MEPKLTITKENHPDWYQNYYESFSKKLEKAQRIVGILETVSNAVGECYSPSIILNGLGELDQHDPYFHCTEWLSIDGKRVGVMTIGHSFYAPEIFNQYDDIYQRREAIYNRHIINGKFDPAFEIIRQLQNNWWGRRPEREISHPNLIADKILDELKCQSLQ